MRPCRLPVVVFACLLAALSTALAPDAARPFSSVEPGYRVPANRPGKSGGLRLYFARASFADEEDPAVSRHSEESLRKIAADLDAYFRRQSYGLLSVAKADISPVIPLKESREYDRFSPDPEAKPEPGKPLPMLQVRAKRNAPRDVMDHCSNTLGFDVMEEYDVLLVMLNASPTKGRVAAPGVAAFASGNGVTVFLTARPSWRVFAHEIGHVFGLGHAFRVSPAKGDAVLPPKGERRFTEYGDPMTPMGRGSNSFSVIEKYAMGWVGGDATDARHVRKVEPGEHELVAFDRPTATGALGLYLEDDFGIHLAEATTTRDRPAGPDPKNDKTTQRLWLSVVSADNGPAAVRDLEVPRLVLKLSSVNGARGPKARTITLPAEPAPPGRRSPNAPFADGLAPGEKCAIRMPDGRELTIEFATYDKQRHLARVRVAFSLPPR